VKTFRWSKHRVATPTYFQGVTTASTPVIYASDREATAAVYMNDATVVCAFINDKHWQTATAGSDCLRLVSQYFSALFCRLLDDHCVTSWSTTTLHV